MSVFGADQLEGMRATVAASLDDSCTRRRFAAGAADAFGNATQGAVADVTLACRKVPAPGNEDTVDRDVQTHEAAFLFEYDADVVGDDEIVHDAVTWQVIGPATAQSWPTHLRVIVRRTEAL